MSDNTDLLLPALAAAQAAYPTISKDKTARVETKAGGSYTYDYLDLAGIMQAVRGPNAEQGLIILHFCITIDSQLYSESRIVHAPSGQHITSRLPLDSRLTAQALGAQLTYCQKYCTKGLLGIQADEDTDAEGVDEEQKRLALVAAAEAADAQVAANQKNAFLKSAWGIFKAAGINDRDNRYKLIEDACGCEGVETVEELDADGRSKVLALLAERHPAVP